MRLFGKAKAEPTSSGGLKLSLASQTGVVIDMEVKPVDAALLCEQINMAVPRQGNMSKLKEVTDFMKYEVADMQKQAEAVHAKAMKVKTQFGAVLDSAYVQLDETDKELAELQAAMGLSSNFPPSGGLE